MSNFGSTDWSWTFKEGRSRFINNASAIFLLSLLFLKWLPIILKYSSATSTCSFSLLYFKMYDLVSLPQWLHVLLILQYCHPNDFLQNTSLDILYRVDVLSFVLKQLLNRFPVKAVCTLTFFDRILLTCLFMELSICIPFSPWYGGTNKWFLMLVFSSSFTWISFSDGVISLISLKTFVITQCG